jgi:hypothetical protein
MDQREMDQRAMDQRAADRELDELASDTREKSPMRYYSVVGDRLLLIGDDAIPFSAIVRMTIFRPEISRPMGQSRNTSTSSQPRVIKVYLDATDDENYLTIKCAKDQTLESLLSELSTIWAKAIQ